MSKTSPAFDLPLRARLEKLAAFEPQNVPVVSLYLNLRPDEHGRDRYDAFLRKVFAEHPRAFHETSAERASLERDIEHINEYLGDELNRSANGLALFAAAGAGEFFEAIQLEAPVDEHLFFLGPVPHIYPLARIIDQYPRYASVLLDSNRARIYVFSLGAVERREQVTGVKTRRTSMGGWSQARYQRHAENFHLHHIKEVVETLDRIVRADRIAHVIVAGDEVVVSLLKEQLPAHLAEKVVDVLTLDRHAGEDQIVEATLDVLRQRDSETDAERVREVVDAWHGSGLGVVGPEATFDALKRGQVDELLISAVPMSLKPVAGSGADAPSVMARTSAPATPDPRRLAFANELIALAQQTAARVRMIEDADLLADFGGVVAMLRYRI